MYCFVLSFTNSCTLPKHTDSLVCVVVCNSWEKTWLWQPEGTPPRHLKVRAGADVWPLCFHYPLRAQIVGGDKWSRCKILELQLSSPLIWDVPLWHALFFFLLFLSLTVFMVRGTPCSLLQMNLWKHMQNAEMWKVSLLLVSVHLKCVKAVVDCSFNSWHCRGALGLTPEPEPFLKCLLQLVTF